MAHAFVSISSVLDGLRLYLNLFYYGVSKSLDPRGSKNNDKHILGSSMHMRSHTCIRMFGVADTVLNLHEFNAFLSLQFSKYDFPNKAIPPFTGKGFITSIQVWYNYLDTSARFCLEVVGHYPHLSHC